MPNALTDTGLTTATQTELLTALKAAMQSIYGADINLNSNSPDGQITNIFVQSMLDVEDLLTQIYNSFDPDQAFGVTLDQRCAINGIQRQAGTYTVTNITIVTSQGLTLQGLDLYLTAPYTVQDSAGNQWQLQTTQTPASAGTYVYAFQAAQPGATLTNIGTITQPVTVVLGVTSINNPTTYSTLGLDEESDSALRIRRQQSTALSSQGYQPTLIAALSNIPRVTFADVYENNSNGFDGLWTDVAYPNGTPGHSIWPIVAGSGAAADIASAIYKKRNAGCGMRGEISFVITQTDGTPFTVYWDVVSPVNLYIQFSISSIDGINPPDKVTILAQLPTLFTPAIFAEVNINQLATIVQQIDSNALVTNAGFSFSAMGPFTNTLTPLVRNNQFAVSSANINITVL